MSSYAVMETMQCAKQSLCHSHKHTHTHTRNYILATLYSAALVLIIQLWVGNGLLTQLKLRYRMPVIYIPFIMSRKINILFLISLIVTTTAILFTLSGKLAATVAMKDKHSQMRNTFLLLVFFFFSVQHPRSYLVLPVRTWARAHAHA